MGAGGVYDLIAAFVSWVLSEFFPSKQMLDADAVKREWSEPSEPRSAIDSQPKA
jgi:hypothetical protein